MINAKCPVCGQHTFKLEYELCPVCEWQQDNIQEDDPAFSGGANILCLKDFKAEWLAKSSERTRASTAPAYANLSELLGRSVIVGLLDGTFKEGTVKSSNGAGAREAIDLLVDERIEGEYLDSIDFITMTSDVMYIS